jgi:hypothetical protein
MGRKGKVTGLSYNTHDSDELRRLLMSREAVLECL